MTADNLDRIKTLADKATAALGYTVVDTRLSYQGKRKSLEVTIHRPGGRISLADCEQVSRRLEELIDAEDTALVAGPYLIEVQSPGIERLIRSEAEFAIFAGETVAVKAREDVAGLGYSFKGTLKGLTQGQLVIARPAPLNKAKSSRSSAKEEPVEELAIDISKVSQVRLYPEDLYSSRAGRS